MRLHKSPADENPETSCCILIPFHHREDLLLPLLNHLKQFPTVVVDDGIIQSDWTPWMAAHSNLNCIRSSGDSGFTNTVNIGLSIIETLGFRFVLVLNDDAWIELDDVKYLMQMAQSNRLLSPVIQSKGHRFYGVTIRSWGLVQLNQNRSSRVDALLGTCLLMPSNLRFDSRFHHGFEDLHLTATAKHSGFELLVVERTLCRHVGGASLDSNSLKGLRFSVYGHLCLYNSLRRGPIIWSLYLLRAVFRDQARGVRMKSIQAINYGVLDWVWSAIAARMASSKAGSNKIK